MNVRRAVAGWLLLAASCSPPTDGAEPGTPPRAGRFGSLRDFVLVDRLDAGRAFPLFVDRFEVTRGDWAQFATTDAGRLVDAGTVRSAGNPALPVAGVDLRQARAFATWRFARLPRVEDWAAAVGDGRHPYPWGSREDWTRANAGELGLGQPTPVGTFESGRRGLDQPYDLIGNVSEWTESIPIGSRADHPELEPLAWCHEGRRRVLRTTCLALWQLPGGIVPLAFAAAAGGDRVPREVVGSDFQTSMARLAETVAAGDRRARTGLRLYATPRELLVALMADPGPFAASDLVQVRAFVRRGAHRAALASALRELGDAAPRGGAVAELLRSELGP